MRGGGGHGRGWFGREEEGRNCGDGGDDGDVEDHIRQRARLVCRAQERVDKLPQRASEGIREGGDGGCGDTAAGGEPEV